MRVDQTTIAHHEKQIKTFLMAVKAAVTRTEKQYFNSSQAVTTTVIISTTSRSLVGNAKADRCIWKLNRIAAKEAHQLGFNVFEREEIEHRLLFKSEHIVSLHNSGAGANVSVVPKIITPLYDAIFTAPAPQIVATSLLEMIGCLQDGQKLLSQNNSSISVNKSTTTLDNK